MQENRFSGSFFALAAFLIWGMFPLYFKTVAEVPAFEMLAHRAIWVMLTLLPIILALGWWKRVRIIFKDSLTLKYMLASTFLLSVNWLIFIWAIANNFVLQSSLGYYINPLVNVLLGVVIMKERLRKLQWTAVMLAFTGVIVMTTMIGEVPWISIALGITFAIYGLLRKKAPVEAMPGLFAETALVAPIAFAYIVWLWLGAENSAPVVMLENTSLLLLVIASGGITAVPLIFFAAAARRLPLSMLGFFQYITPTGHFILAVYVFNEPFTDGHLVSFALIWLALVLYTTDLIQASRVPKT